MPAVYALARTLCCIFFFVAAASTMNARFVIWDEVWVGQCFDLNLAGGTGSSCRKGGYNNFLI